ncbi:hypothetical protein BC830DRAFT_1069248 [Chytriomyces sp. MP71]|nr:hypothetical protein BC830DRAFT_1069248 [Chytriomyces sp. MP71]
MSLRETSIKLPDGFSPLERILLTANGNVQRILSAFYNNPVRVKIINNDRKPVSPPVPHGTDSPILAEFDREVQLVCGDSILCTATSTITLGNAEYVKLVVEDGIGIGQLFRHLSILPDFELINVGRDEGVFWRVYSLSNGHNVRCVLKEVFPIDVFTTAINTSSVGK